MVEMTCRGLAGRLVNVGMVTQERADAALTQIDSPGHDVELGPDDLLDMLAEFGVTVLVHGEDIDDLRESYQDILEQAAACSGRSVLVSDVELTEDENGESLNFHLNGEPRSWPVEHQADDYLDQLAIWENIEDLEPGGGDPRVFHPIPGEDTCADDVYLLATPEQARALRDDLGLKIDIRDPSE